MSELDTISGYVVFGFIAIVVIYFMVKSAKNSGLILVNTLFGGTLFVALQILNAQIPINIITLGVTALLGVPGVILLLILKFMGVL